MEIFKKAVGSFMSHGFAAIFLVGLACPPGLASEFDDLGERSKAKLQNLNREIVLHPRDPKGYADRGEFYSKASMDDEAEADFKHAIQLQPTNYLTYYKKGDHELLIEDYKAALADYLKMAQYAPDSEKGIAYRHVGRAQIKLKQYAEGVKSLTAGLTFETPETIHLTLKERATCYLQLQKYKEAIADVNAMGQVKPVRNDEALAIRAEAEFALGQTQASIDDFTLALNIAKKRPASLERAVFAGESSIYYKLRARSYKKLGKDDLAEADLKNAKGVEKETLDFAPFR